MIFSKQRWGWQEDKRRKWSGKKEGGE